jgi:hypothetical protein
MGIFFAIVSLTYPMMIIFQYWHLIFRNRMKENPTEGDAGNSCQREIPEQDWLSPKESMRKPATPIAERKYPYQVP